MKARILAVVGCVCLMAGCAARTPALDRSAVVPVDAALVPPALRDQGLTIDLDTTTDVRDAMRSIGPQLLVSDARMWDVHHGQRLIGALELATLKKRVDPRRRADRDRVIGQILGSHTRQIQVDGLPVWTITDDGSARRIYTWFGARSFGVLQLKGDDLNLGQIADTLVQQIASQAGWHALAPQDYRRKGQP